MIGPGGPPVAGTEVLSLHDVGKSYGGASALRGVTTSVRSGEVTCVLGDNGAGKSTLIKVVSGVHPHTEGRLVVRGEEVRFTSPRDALEHGIATVHQDLALVPLMPVWRNFFLGAELTRGRGPLRRLDVRRMKEVTGERLTRMGVHVPDLDRPVGTLSGGQRQCVAIARAVHFGAQVLVLDEPTAALGVKQSGVVLKHVGRARDAGLAVVLVTHNPRHAHLLGDRFVVLARGEVRLDEPRDRVTLERLTDEMAGGAELEALSRELSAAAPEASREGR